MISRKVVHRLKPFDPAVFEIVFECGRRARYSIFTDNLQRWGNAVREGRACRACMKAMQKSGRRGDGRAALPERGWDGD